MYGARLPQRVWHRAKWSEIPLMAELTRIDLLLLGLLMDRPMHGYELHQKIQEEEVDRWFNLSLPGIYYSLGKLRDRGLVVEMQSARSAGSSRAVCRVTETGREAFFEALESEAVSESRTLLDYDLVVYFLNMLPVKRAEDLLEQRRSHLAQWDQHLQLRSERETSVMPLRRRALLEHARLYAEMELEWTDCLLRGIRGEPVFAGPPDGLMLLSGDLVSHHLPDLIRLISSGRQSGTLTVSDGQAVRTLSFQDGRPVCATSMRQQADEPSRWINDRQEVLDDIYDVFRWQEGPFTFDQSLGLSEGCFVLDMAVDQLLLEGCRWVDNWQLLQRLVPSPDSVFERVSPEGGEVNLHMSSQERQVLSLVNGVLSVAQLALEAGLTLFEGSRVLYGLAAVGLVRLAHLDKIRLRRAFREIAELVCRSTFQYRSSPEDFSCEVQVNLAASGLPIRLNRSRIEDDTDPGLDGRQLAKIYCEFLQTQLRVIGERFGASVAKSSFEQSLRRLAPDLHTVAEDFGLTLPALTDEVDKRAS
jgi:DNA-binding PadR family transcriptional regulator